MSVSPTEVSLGSVRKLALFGGSWLLAALLPKVRKLPWAIEVFTSPRHLEDAVNGEGQTLAEVLRQAEVPFQAVDEISPCPALEAFVDGQTLGIAIGAAWVFPHALASKFSGKFFDFMGIDLPRYRGGAHYTWAILNQHRRGACNLQVIEGGSETFHRGKILCSESYVFPLDCRTPQDFFEFAVPRETAFLEAFFDRVQRQETFRLSALDESQRSFYPFLNTKLNGWVDWSWSVAEIERFICAFDNPYPGASTLWRGQRVFLKNTVFHERDGTFHPFTAGLVLRAAAGEVHVAARGGTLVIREIRDESQAPVVVQEGDRLFTPARELESALVKNVSYGGKGLEVAPC